MYAVPEYPEALNSNTPGNSNSATPSLVEGKLLVSPGTPGSKWPTLGREGAGEYWIVAAGTLREGSLQSPASFSLNPPGGTWYSGTTVGGMPQNCIHC